MSEEKVLIYSGKGASHSWVWLADLLESRGVLNSEFVNADQLSHALPQAPTLVVISGGDGFEIGTALAPKCLTRLRDYIDGGGKYFGVCAGAYLPLPSKLEPLIQFNLSRTKIANISTSTELCSDVSPRVAVRYGSCSIFHPVRGEIEVESGTTAFSAPIFGGPIFCEPESDETILRYRSLTTATDLQCDRDEAESLMIGKPAVIRCLYGHGELVLAGPHLEHPSYPRANEFFMKLTGLCPVEPRCEMLTNRAFESRDLDGHLADLKVAVLGMERETFLVGSKLWDGSRMLELVMAIERRTDTLDDDTVGAIMLLLEECREDLLSMGPERVHDSDSAPQLLVEAARLAVNKGFEARRG